MFFQATVLQGALTATYNKHELIGQKEAKLQFKSHGNDNCMLNYLCEHFFSLGCEESIVGRKSMELVMFDILKESVSIHQPLPRMIASNKLIRSYVCNVVNYTLLALSKKYRNKC